VAHVPDTLDDADLTLVPELVDAVANADAVVLVTRWQEYEGLPALLERQGATPLFVDGRRMLRRGSVSRYAGIGM